MFIQEKIRNFVLLTLFFFCSAGSFAGNKQPIKAVVFSDFAIFSSFAVTDMADKLLPGQGDKVIEILFDYQMLGATDGPQDLASRTEVSLVFVSEQMRFTLPEDKRKNFLKALMNLKAWPDVSDALKQLNSMDIDLVFLSNMEEAMLSHQLKQENLDKEFNYLLSADDTDTQKQDGSAYELVLNKLNLPKDAILFVTDAESDVKVTKEFGYAVYWINRVIGASQENVPSGNFLDELVKFVEESNKLE